MSKYILIVLLMIGNSVFAAETMSGNQKMSECFSNAMHNAYKAAINRVNRFKPSPHSSPKPVKAEPVTVVATPPAKTK